MLVDIECAKNITLELDADSLVYRIAGMVDMLGGGKNIAIKLIHSSIENMFEDTECNKCNIYLGTSTNYRIDIAKSFVYKGNRKGAVRPQFYDAIRAYLVSEFSAILVHNEEAEDRVGIEAHYYDDYSKYIVGAIDKDMDMIAGHRYNYSRRKMYFIDKYEALRSFYTQLVSGDKSVDNIPGLYHLLLKDGLEEQAHKFKYSRYKSKLIAVLKEMNTEEEMWNHVKSIYTEHGELDRHGLTRIIEIGRLLWIRRYADELWVPYEDRDFDYIDLDTRGT